MDYEALREIKNSTNLFAIYNGITVTEIREGYARAELKVEEHHRNGSGNVHGGCQYTLADVTCGSAASSFGYICATVSDSFHFLEGVRDEERLVCEAKAVHHGRRTTVLDVEVRSGDGTVLYSKGTFTYALSSIPVQREGRGKQRNK